ncbi:MAG: sugar transferase [Cognatishimia sp.]
MNYERTAKRALDLVLSFLLIPAILPVILVLYGLVKLSGGAGFYAHKRVGRGGRIFKCLKIRTMQHGAQARLQDLLRNDPNLRAEWRMRQKLKCDPRVTRFGRFLRQTNLDELPQIWNVIKGDMSLVGPRPVTMQELHKYGDAHVAYEAVRPGITGLWQVSGRNELSYQKRVELDEHYVRYLSFAGDLRILFKTILKVLRPDGM